jgi:Mrp family chromosome partitioning ATPase
MAAVEKKRKEGGDVMGTMTLRDYFAAKAMQALLSDTDWRLDMDIEDTAKAAYMAADAMMKAREA